MNGVGQALQSMKPTAPPSASAVRDAVSRIEELVKHAHGGIDALTERLDVVVRPVPPSGTASEGPMPTASCQLEERLLVVVAALASASQRIQELHSRIEL